MPPIRPLAEIQRRLLEHQRRQKLGDRVHSTTTLARKADVNPSTMYAAIAGERLDHQIQIRSTRMV
jgi:DNA-binding transcriptional regulator YhcF (GntR family)